MRVNCNAYPTGYVAAARAVAQALGGVRTAWYDCNGKRTTPCNPSVWRCVSGKALTASVRAAYIRAPSRPGAVTKASPGLGGVVATTQQAGCGRLVACDRAPGDGVDAGDVGFSRRDGVGAASVAAGRSQAAKADAGHLGRGDGCGPAGLRVCGVDREGCAAERREGVRCRRRPARRGR